MDHDQHTTEHRHHGRGADDPAFAFGAFGPPPWARFGPGPGRGFGPFGGDVGRGRARRGDVRAAVIALLNERPMHGYEIIQELGSRTSGAWRPSPGSVYPTLQLLEDEGLVVAEEVTGKRVFSLTEEGRAAKAERVERKAPWEEMAEGLDPGILRLRESVGQLISAVHQAGSAGSSAQRSEVEAILDDARRRIYSVLASE